MDEAITKYAIVTKRTELRMHISAELPAEQCASLQDTRLTVEAGTLLKVFHTNAPVNQGNRAGSGSNSRHKFSTVQVLDFVKHDPIYENNLYECTQSHLRKVPEDIWPFLIGIADGDRRLRFVQNTEQWRYALYLKKNDMVSVNGEFHGRPGTRYDCIIRYIGPVEELYPVGYYFGLELLHLDSGYSPQAESVRFSIKYMQCDPSLSIFTTADWISQLPSEVKKKFPTKNLLTDTIEKVRNAINPNSCLNGPTNTSSLSREKKVKRKEPTAQFYDAPTTPQEPHSSKVNGLDFSTKNLSPPRSLSPSTSNYNSSNNNSKQNSMERRKPKSSENEANDSTDKPMITFDSDEYKNPIESYEKTLERQFGNSSNNSNSNSNSINLSNGVSNSAAATNIPAPQPTGILKHRHASSAASSSNRDENIPNRPLIMRLEDRDLIVIDKADIRESTKHESDVVIVDKQHEVDLTDLLGGNWPKNAGDVAAILNKSKDANAAIKSERVKSANPLSHIGGSSKESTSARHHQRMAAEQRPSTVSYAEVASLPAVEHTKNKRKYQYDDTASYANILHLDTAAAAATASDFPATLAVPEADFIEASPLQEVPDSGLGIGSMVEVSIPDSPDDLYGVIRWIGMPPGANSVMVGVELEDDQSNNKHLLTTDGSFNGVPLFKCPENRALFVSPEHCASDRRFSDTDGAAASNKPVNQNQSDSKMFGQVECPSVPGAIAPLKILNLEELEEICGKFKGIQGHHNSCYLDATLFSMFAFTSVFDSLLFRPPEADDIAHYSEVQKVLREEIVNPLRKNKFVRADRVMKLRQLLDKLSSVSGLTSEEKDPEEFLNSLLAQIMRAEPFLKLSSGQDAYFYQLFVEKDERLSFPTVQQLFEQSFHSSDLKLKEVPSCLIIQMPRFGKNFKMYPRILPSQVLDVTDIIEDSPRQCSVCGELAEFECRDCFGTLQRGVGLESTAFCAKCLETAHMHTKRTNHSWKKLSVPQDFRIMAEHMSVPRLYMELFAVVCIETSHYVAFVKAGCGPDAPWCFFDSMADRKGEKNGYNIPEMITVPDVPHWLSDEGSRAVNETSSNDKMLPEHAKRLFCDAYMCMYQSTDVMMYR